MTPIGRVMYMKNDISSTIVQFLKKLLAKKRSYLLLAR